MRYTNLYLNTEYSMLQSSCRLEDTFEALRKYNYHAAAITDDGNMYGVVKFYRLAEKYNIKPILGLQLKYEYNGYTSNILLYAMNNFGYRNLMKLSSIYMINNKKIDLNEVLNNSLGLLVIIPFTESILYQYYLNRNYNMIFQHLEVLKSSFDQLYVGLSRQGEKEIEITKDCYDMFSGNHYKMVAISKVSYLDATDIDVYQTLKSIANSGDKVTISDKEKSSQLYSPEEIEVIFNGFDDLIKNTEEIVEKCNVKLEFGKYYLPRYDECIDANLYLKELSYRGLQKRLKQNGITNITPYYERIDYELDTIKSMGFSDYFLIVWDFIKYAKTNGIYVGPGRGSAPASLVGYSLGITDIDPIRYNLLFERFLNKERISMPDIDTDFPDDKRDEVIKYVGKKYGASRVAHIVTFGTFKAKLALRDASRVYKLSDVRLNEILKRINSLSLKEIYTSSLKQIIEHDQVLQKLMEDYEDINQVLSAASKMEGLPRNTSTHAAGIIITRNDLVHHTPLDNGLDDIYQTQYESSDLEALGLLKMDFLGLRNLTNIDKCLQLIKQNGIDFSFPKEMNDQETFRMLARGDVSGVFQLESAGMRKVLMDLKVNSFEDIASALALYRPGPMDMIPHFIARKLGKEKIEYPHPDLEPILKETYGTIVYQDQIMLIARKFAGYSLGRADILRRAVSKKKLEVLEAERENFVTSSLKQGYSDATANLIYDYIVKFASYGFNKAHSFAYAKVSYQTAYLKCHYQTYYLATLMSSVIGSDTDIKLYYQEALKKKIPVKGPSINDSFEGFITDGKIIIFPLTVIRGLGSVKVNDIIEERKKGKFTSFEDFVKRTSNFLAGSVIENIIYSGALDSFGISKKAMIDNYQTIIDRMAYDFVANYVPQEYDQDEFTYGELLEREKNIIGLNIKYNFLNQYQELYTKYNLMHISDVRENMNVKVLGYIQSIKQVKTKNNETMAFIQFSDDINVVELTLFPNVYSRYNHLRNGQLLMVNGYTQRRKELQIVVNEIKEI